MGTSGIVYLVGAGPGDAGLLTEKGRRCLERADVVVYDRLVSPQVLNHARSGAGFIYVGKEANHHPVPQIEINRLLVTLAEAGQVVVRLKGGDPFVFGRGSEEAQALRQAGITFEVVPGITSAIGALAYAGIPVTHRQMATSFTVVTGHECVSDQNPLVDWSRLTNPHATLVILMGMGHLAEIVQRLCRCGRSPDTLVAVVQWGSTAKQRMVTGTLADIEQIVVNQGIRSPGIIVVGEVVSLCDAVGWYEQVPLFGQRLMIVDWLHEDVARLAAEAERSGAEVISVALEDYVDMDWSSVDGILNAMATDEVQTWWFRNPLEVRGFFHRLVNNGVDFRRLSTRFIGAADGGTAKALSRIGIVPDWTGQPEEWESTSVVRIGGELRCEGLANRLNHVLGGWEGLEWQVVLGSETTRDVLNDIKPQVKLLAVKG